MVIVDVVEGEGFGRWYCDRNRTTDRKSLTGSGREGVSFYRRIHRGSVRVVDGREYSRLESRDGLDRLLLLPLMNDLRKRNCSCY